MNSHRKLKNKLKERRKTAGLTQTQLAEMVRSSKNTISSIETGQFCPTAYLAALLCNALCCKFEELFYFEEETGYVKQKSPCPILKGHSVHNSCLAYINTVKYMYENTGVSSQNSGCGATILETIMC